MANTTTKGLRASANSPLDGLAPAHEQGGWTGSTACLVVGLRRQGQSSQDAERTGDSPEEASRTNMPDRQMLVTQVYKSVRQ